MPDNNRFMLGKPLEGYRAQLFDGDGSGKSLIATFIVPTAAKSALRKLNAHDDLVAALETMVKAYWEDGTSADAQPSPILQARAALAKAAERVP